MNPLLRFIRLDPRVSLPLRATDGSAGLDLHTVEDVVFQAGETTKIRTGLAFELPEGTAGLIIPRSSAFKKGLVIQGLLDEDYRGECFVVAHNVSQWPVAYKAGEAIAQLLIQPYSRVLPLEVQQLGQTARGDGGFGSTGRVGGTS